MEPRYWITETQLTALDESRFSSSPDEAKALDELIDEIRDNQEIEEVNG